MVPLFVILALVLLGLVYTELRRIRALQETTASRQKAELKPDRARSEVSRWEYCVVQPGSWNEKEYRFDFWVNGEVDEVLSSRMSHKNTQRFLELLGHDGWELVTVLALATTDGKSPGEREWLYYLKRPYHPPDSTT
jgi:hypothetical protein